jgi:tRNA-dihydrouridine synthase B
MSKNSTKLDIFLDKLNSKKTLFMLAPLAGYTDLPFRTVVKKFGADLTVSEMISSNALVHNSAKTFKMLEKSNLEEPYSVQLSGSQPDILKQSVEILNEQNGIDIIDLNSGCPAPKVVSHGSGSALLKDLNKLEEMTATIKKYSKKPITSVKVRIGFNEKYPVDVAKAVENGGADFIVVHGRTRKGQFKSQVDYDAIKLIKESVKIPVIANGDITDFEKSQEVLSHTKTDGVMIGRGAIGKPWIFYQLQNNTNSVSEAIKKEIILEHFDNMIKFYGDRGAIIFRKHIHTYSKGYQQASAFRDEVNRIENPQTFRDKISEFFN